MKVRFSRPALAELDAILVDLASNNPAAAKRFKQRVRTITERIGRFPRGFQELADRPGVRRVPLVRYPYLMFYKIVHSEAVVLRIIHGARREPWEDL